MNKESNVKVGNTGVGFVGFLTIAFIVLKLLGAISWSWFWVLSPVWISVGLGVLSLVILFLLSGRSRK